MELFYQLDTHATVSKEKAQPGTAVPGIECEEDILTLLSHKASASHGLPTALATGCPCICWISTHRTYKN